MARSGCLRPPKKSNTKKRVPFLLSLSAEYSSNLQTTMSSKKKPVPSAAIQAKKEFAFKGKEGFLFSGLFFLIFCVVYNDFLFGNKLFLFTDIGSDTFNVFLPHYYHLADYWKEYGWPSWTFSEGMGQDLLPFSFGNPFHFLYAVAGREEIPGLLIYAEGIKMWLAGYFFFRFLKSANLGGLPSLMGALLISFSGFLVVGGTWYQFSYEAVYFSLLLWGLENLHRGKSWIILFLAFFLAALNQPFNLALCAGFALLYVGARSFLDPSSNTRSVVNKFAWTGLSLLLGTGLAFYFFLPNLLQMLQSPRGSGPESYFAILSSAPVFAFGEAAEYISLILRTFSSDLTGTGSEYKGWQNYLEAPMTYSGLLPFLLLPQIFWMSSGKIRNKIMLISGILLLPFVYPWFRYAFWLFSGDYYRIISLLLNTGIILSTAVIAKEILNKKSLNIILLFSSLGFLLLVLFFPMDEMKGIIKPTLRYEIAGFLAVYVLTLWWINQSAEKRNLVFVLIGITVLELSLFSSHSISGRKEWSSLQENSGKGFNDETQKAINYIKEKDVGFFRIQKDFSSGPAIHRSLNDAKAQGFFGTSSYNSFPHESYIRFFQKSNIIEEGDELAARWVPGLFNRVLLHNLTSSNYILTQKTNSYPRSMGYDSVGSTGNIHIWKNHFSLPLGFTYHAKMAESDYLKLSPTAKDKAMQLSAIVGDDFSDSEIKTLNFSDTSSLVSFQFLENANVALKKDTLALSEFSPDYMEGIVSAGSPGLLFLSIPFDKGWKCTLNDKAANIERINLGFQGIKIPAGEWKLKIWYERPYNKLTWIVMLGSLIILFAFLFIKPFSNLNPETISNAYSLKVIGLLFLRSLPFFQNKI